MSSSRDIRDYLVDMVDALRDIGQFTQGMSYEDFCNDKKTIYAVTRGFEILGEAAKPGSPLANDRGDARQAHS